MSAVRTTPIKIFLSHTSEYAHIAKSLRMSMLAMSSLPGLIDVKVNEEMFGGVEWRRWIEENTRDADAFVFLYPSAESDIGWPGFEVARFTAVHEKTVVWIRNPGLKKTPGMFEQYQSYFATEEDILKFFNEVFVEGLFSDGQPLNADVNRFGSNYYNIAVTAARELAELFANATIRPQYYTRRIVISIASDKDRKLDPAQSYVEGDPEGMKMIGMQSDVPVTWSAVLAKLGNTVEWPGELESEIASIVSGALPAHLSPFDDEHRVFIPVIAKTEMVRSHLRRLIVLFIEANSEKLRRLFQWEMPEAMPGQVASFVLLVRLVLRIRFEILEPRYQAAKFQWPDRKGCIELSKAVLDEYVELRTESRKIGIYGTSALAALFDKSLLDRVDTATGEYIKRIKALRAYLEKLEAGEAEPDPAATLAELLQGLRENNAHWLALLAEQFVRLEWR
jgi:hypothetical protein